jgi:hypothetical protein
MDTRPDYAESVAPEGAKRPIFFAMTTATGTESGVNAEEL